MTHSIVTADEKIRHFKRIVILEKFIMLPAKLIVVVASAVFLWQVRGETEFKFVFYRYQFWMYVLGNLIFILTLIKLGQRKVNFKIVKLSAFFLSVIDNLFLSFLIYFSNGLESEFYWLYCGLMIRNAVNFPRIKSQSALNLSFIIFYIIAIYLHDQSYFFLHNQVFWLKVTVLGLVGICCWGIYNLLSKKTRTNEELQEMTLRAEKISLAGKIAAGIAHELKNPFGIIINSVYILETLIDKSASEVKKHLGTIRKEILRSDRIITDLLNYSRLVEGKVEKIDINQAIDKVINDMGPEFLKSIKIEKKYKADLP
ncbi:MAG: histidine kinase dimerization/phospho-acceptor domain-containing protein, partial [bacterium]|nr:histidine kinase dimerization/phospho-acceptor domain-containing protein [bacterium]